MIVHNMHTIPFFQFRRSRGAWLPRTTVRPQNSSYTSSNGNALVRFVHTRDVKTGSGAGFTLIEAMVSISILLVGVTGAMTLASNSIATASYTRNKLTASLLAQEAIEAIQARRDSNLLGMTSNTADRTGIRFYSGLLTVPPDCNLPLATNTYVVAINPMSNTSIQLITKSPTNDEIKVLTWSVSGQEKKFFWQGTTVPVGTTASPTIFKRFVTVSETTNCSGSELQELNVVSTVTWTDKTGQPKQLDVKTTMYNWLPYILQQP
mgnify:CR=1 FL=1